MYLMLTCRDQKDLFRSGQTANEHRYRGARGQWGDNTLSPVLQFDEASKKATRQRKRRLRLDV